ncbi:MAG: M23 family metallopeptidase [Patescibacteria group bacterium]
MARTSGHWQRWKKEMGRFWRTSCRPWLCRRNVPYFVLLALLAFLAGGSLARREQRRVKPRLLAAPVVQTGEENPIRLGQGLDEVIAAWRADLDRSVAAPGTQAPVLDPSAFLPPCRGTVVTGRGWRRDEKSGVWYYHRGLDLKAAADEPVRAAAPGKVIRVAEADEGGMLVELDHGQGWRSVYACLSQISVGQGAELAGGAVIGRPAAGIVHFELWQDKASLDPLQIIRGFGSG